MYTIRFLEEGGPQSSISWLVWVVLIVFLLMVFLGWLVASKGWLKKEEEPQHVEHDHDEHASVESQPAPVKSSTPDDLTQLEGIGPKVAQVLAGIGIITFEDLAKADPVQLRSALDAAGYKYMEPAGWIEQAAFAAKGDTEGLRNLQDSLKGGRKAA
jgi:predicted flap endonuclease-1-like 5' DNA nuclease